MEASEVPNHGRGAGGRFTPGNKLGRGNPLAKRVASLRNEMYAAVGPGELRAVIERMIANAKAGDNVAARELLQRLLGPPEAADVLERIEALEEQIAQLAERTVQ